MDVAPMVSTSSSSSGSCPNWARDLEPDVVQLIGSKLDHPYVPGSVHLASICRAWRAAAADTRNLSVTWYSRSQLPFPLLAAWQQQVYQTLTPWLSRYAQQLVSFGVVSYDCSEWDLQPVYMAMHDVATTAAAAGTPLRLQRFHLPFTPRASMLSPTPLVSVLPFLCHLSLPLNARPEGDDRQHMPAFLEALRGLHHLRIFEVGLRAMPAFVSNDQVLQHWEQLLEAAPKQLQQLSFQLLGDPDSLDPAAHLAYTFEPLVAFKQLQRLQLGGVVPECDLAPLKQLPSLSSLGIKQRATLATFDSLVPVEGLLQDLDVGFYRAIAMDEEQHFKQLTALTSLTMHGAVLDEDPLPQQVAAGLQRLDWTLHDDWLYYDVLIFTSGSGSRSSSSDDIGSAAGPELAKCSTQLKELHLRGNAWASDAAAAGDTLRQLTGLTSFGFHCERRGGRPLRDLGSWPSHPPMQHMKQLRSLAVPVELLVTDQPWLGGLPHLTSLQLEVERCALTPPGALGPEEVFGGDEAKVLANLTSCCSTLKVLRLDMVVLFLLGMVRQDELPAVPAVKAWFKNQLPGVYTVLTWHAEGGNTEQQLEEAVQQAYGG